MIPPALVTWLLLMLDGVLYRCDHCGTDFGRYGQWCSNCATGVKLNKWGL